MIEQNPIEFLLDYKQNQDKENLSTNYSISTPTRM